MRNSYRFLIVLALIGLGLGGFLWWRAEAPPRVRVALPQRGPAVEAVYATGTVEPVRWAKIASTETGRIVAYPAVEGQAVQTGEVLVRLDDIKARAQVRELEVRVDFLERDLQRYAALVKSNTVSRQVYERVQSDLDQARASLAVARQQLADLTIVAPLDGIVLRKDGEVGEVVKSDDVLLWIGQDRPYWITAEVDEEDVPRVAFGQRTLITADAFPGEVFDGAVAEITPMGDPINKNYRVRVLLPADSPLLIGMTVEANIVVRVHEEALLVPEAAVVADAVWVAAQDRAQRRPVQTGVYGNGMVEIRGGLAADEPVILDPPARLSDGAAVRVWSGKP
ncbi:MAG TPA: efflux RND transporter periplasmic adaptor subunit [Kiloniellales bacterium]